MKNLLLLFSFLLIINTAYSQTNIPPGNVSGTWTFLNSPYNIQGDISIPDDSTLIIEPGVAVVFQGHYALYVLGQLKAVGTPANRITFTVNDTTGFYDPDTTLGGWYGIRFIDTPQDNDTSQISFCNLQFGKAVGEDWFFNAGGAFCVLHFDKVIISDCNITHCSAGGPQFAVGGALAVGWSDIQLINNTISFNKADAGGAAHFFDSDPLLVNNMVEYNSASEGGAFDIQFNSHPSFMYNQINYNSVSGNGGAINIGGDSVVAVFVETTISGNSAHYGGGINLWNGELQLNNCSLTDNSASWIAGGIHAGYSKLSINNTSFDRDTAAVFGGAMGMYYSELTITNSAFTDNSAGVLGGAIHSDFTDINISNTTFERDTAGNAGGAVFAWQCQMQIEDCSFTDNSATYNGGAVATDSTTAGFIQNTFLNNRSVWGGAINCSRGSISLTDNSFTSNIAEHGGAVNGNLADLQMDINSFEQNSGFWGGALSLYNCNITADSCAFLQNHASEEAGAIEYMVDTASFNGQVSLQISRSYFTENVSDNLYAGVKVMQQNSDTSLCYIRTDKNIFRGNSANQYSGIRFLGNINDIQVNNTIFENNYNSGTWATSILSANGGAKVKINNSVFAKNYPRALSANINSELDIMNSTIVNNFGAPSGALSLRNNADATLTNSILWNNGDKQVTMVTVNSMGNSLTINNTDFQYGPDSISVSDSLSIVYWGTGNLLDDPLLADTLNSDFHLDNSSPCIGAGIDSIQISGIWYISPAVDIEGNPRPNPSTSMPDMGAYENELSAPIPVELTSFTASLNDGKVTLCWTTKTEKNNLGFNIERKTFPGNNKEEWLLVGFQKGSGTTTNAKEYSFVDDINGIAANSFSYRLKQVDYNGSYHYSKEVMVENSAPIDFALYQNYPNPFNSSTIIEYSIREKAFVNLSLVNILGEEVSVLVNKEKESGYYKYNFNAAGLSSGIYLLRLKAEDNLLTRKIVLIK